MTVQSNKRKSRTRKTDVPLDSGLDFVTIGRGAAGRRGRPMPIEKLDFGFTKAELANVTIRKKKKKSGRKSPKRRSK